jgi:DNA-binding response OmpR family regulator
MSPGGLVSVPFDGVVAIVGCDVDSGCVLVDGVTTTRRGEPLEHAATAAAIAVAAHRSRSTGRVGCGEAMRATYGSAIYRQALRRSTPGKIRTWAAYDRVAMSDQRILVIEDDEVIGRNVSAALAGEGYDVSLVGSSAAAGAAMAAHAPALVLLDLGLPDGDGLDVCRALRDLDPSARILILTARTEDVDVVVGLDAGAHDYLRKPFSLSELLARIRVQLREFAEVRHRPTLTLDDLRVERNARRVFVGDQEIELRPKEYDLLLLLASNSGSVLTRERIMDEVWDWAWASSTKTLDMHVSSLRKKLARSSVRIVTLRNVGYRMEP